MAHRNLTIEQRNEIIILYDEGLNLSHIAEEMGISRNTVRRWVRRHEGEGHVNNRHRAAPMPIISGAKLEQMLEKYKESSFIPTRQIAEEFGCTMQTVRNALHRNKVYRGKPAQKQKDSEPHSLNDSNDIKPEAESCTNPEEFIKQELLEENTVKTAVCELYDNEVKMEELVLSPTMLQQSVPVVLRQRTCVVTKVEPDAEEAAADTSVDWSCASEVSQDDHDLTIKVEPETAHAGVKQEIIYDDKVVATDEVSELYEDHEVKEELVLGPTVLQRPALIEQHTNGVKEQGVNSRLMQCAAEARVILRDETCCDVKSKLHTCNTCEEELSTTVTVEDIEHHALADSQRDESVLKYCNLNVYLPTHTEEKLVRQSNFNKHLRRIFVRDRPYKCNECNKEFTLKSRLEIHTRIHTGDKPYKCYVCSKGFTQKTYVQQHTRIHTGEKPYKCDVCIKKFTTKSSLKIHTRIHMGYKPYKRRV